VVRNTLCGGFGREKEFNIERKERGRGGTGCERGKKKHIELLDLLLKKKK
jgi:hypothetical protein